MAGALRSGAKGARMATREGAHIAGDGPRAAAEVTPAEDAARSGENAASYRSVLQPLARDACRGSIVRCIVRLLDPTREWLVPIAGWEAYHPDRAFFSDWMSPPLLAAEGTPWGDVVSSRKGSYLDTADFLVPSDQVSEATAAYISGFHEHYGHTRFALLPLLFGDNVLGIAAFGALGSTETIDSTWAEQITARIALSVRIVQLEARISAELVRRRESGLVHEETAELFRIGWELSSNGLATLGADGEILELNSALALMMGYSPGDLVGRNASEFVTGDTARLASLYEDALLGRRTVIEVQHEVRHAQGHAVSVAITARLLNDARGRPRVFFVQLTDLTEARTRANAAEGRRQVSEALARQQPLVEILNRIAGLLEDQVRRARASILVVDEGNGRLQIRSAPSFNPQFVEAIDGGAIDPDLGPYATAAFLGRSVNVSDAQTDHRWEEFGELAAAHRIRSVWVTPVIDGDDRVLAVVAIHLPDMRAPSVEETRLSEAAARLVGIAVDRERERVRLARQDRELRRISQQQSMIMDSVSDGILSLTLDGRVTYANAAAETLVGWQAAELIGEYMHSKLHHSLPDGSPQPPWRSPIVRSLREGGVHRVRGDTFWAKDGRPITVDYTCSPIEQEDQVVGAVVVLHASSDAHRPPTAHPVLTGREREILQLLARGLRGQQAAAELHISSTTLQSHLKSAIGKLGASGRTHAVALAAARGEIALT